MYDDAAEMPDEMPETPAKYFEGRISIGPIQGTDGKHLLARLEEFGLTIPRSDEDVVDARMTPQGFMVEIEGPGIVGYLLDESGFQVDDDDLADFAAGFLEANDAVVIAGEHLVHKDIKMICKSVVRMDRSLPRPEPVAEVLMTRIGAGIGVDNMRKG